MSKRILAVFILFVAGMNVLMLRLFVFMSDTAYAEAAAAQSTYTVTIASDRPDFADRNGVGLTGVSRKQLAIVFPRHAQASSVAAYLGERERARLESGLQGELPFAVELQEAPPEGLAVNVIDTVARYGQASLARHLIGYLGYDGQGISGLEAALNPVLEQNRVETRLQASINARGSLQRENPVTVTRDTDEKTVQLSIDRDIQRIAEDAADALFEKGAIVVIDCASGGVAAWVSRPDFDPNDVGAAIEADEGALVDCVLGSYNAGSVFKPVVAAAALEAGLSDFRHTCTGAVEVDGTVYTCNNGKAHGELDLAGALECSCNTYFIVLAQRVGPQAIYNMASALRIGKPLRVFGEYGAGRGSFPSAVQLMSSTELANISFGQGLLLTTPLHIAAYTNAIATGGVYTQPWVVDSVLGEAVPRTAGARVFSEQTAQALQAGMQAVMQTGTGAASAPESVSAAGKTGTAQTGLYDDDGQEQIIGWFTGWFPGQQPRYVVTVMVENGGYGFESAAPVFAAIADGVWSRENLR